MKLDILDELQSIDDYVKVTLKIGTVLVGYADCIVYEEDSDGYDTIKMIRFEPKGQKHAIYLGIDDIISFEILA